MGQFYSREFDGDPYIDLMRSLPERELVWWAQKVIWLAEGFTFVDHFARTYPRLFQHKCQRCKGAGVMTCPACRGEARVSVSARRRAALALGGIAEGRSASHEHEPGPDGGCRVCGTACAWDAESEWMERWGEWESRLAYYDKATGPLMDEWYEDVLNAGNLEEDTPPVEDDPPGPEVTGRWADADRTLHKDKKRMAAVMRRWGHPYDADASLGYQIVDPTASMGENVWNMAQVYNSLPPELNPLRTQHLSGHGNGDPQAAVEAARSAFDAQVVMEAALMQNLEAAAQDLPKPHRLPPTAGTVACDECGGAAWGYSLFPNTAVMFGLERPFWGETLARLSKYWNPTQVADPARTGQLLPYGEGGLRRLLAAEREAEGQEANPLEAVVGKAPQTTARYRRDLELLVAHPELRDGALRVPGGWGPEGGLQSYLREQQEEQARLQRRRDLAAVASPLELAPAGK
ncbi:hypothetical protein HYH02_013200 [Chlamydomonas schloesseri]|uniref:Uncharacterized protein n=1 Tax=Chlamydomonas schloesseri TaxID=2026947 RepID=A0A835W020_9CHLO|nr:hypothetical protein HYH02_013200 [Chlamydomonas schloesseri]|eukprot:KAG2431984.1 hypothetical protein HYH02_013200 [Chlamydomonas schloesseri]